MPQTCEHRKDFLGQRCLAGWQKSLSMLKRQQSIRWCCYGTVKSCLLVQGGAVVPSAVSDGRSAEPVQHNKFNNAERASK